MEIAKQTFLSTAGRNPLRSASSNVNVYLGSMEAEFTLCDGSSTVLLWDHQSPGTDSKAPLSLNRHFSDLMRLKNFVDQHVKNVEKAIQIYNENLLK